MKKKKKIALALTAAGACVGILVTGTFAWQSISQQQINEVIDDAGPGGRVHDDFNGQNKDVYAENYTKLSEGGSKVYVRIRLDEYMEIGDDAGRTTDDIGNTISNRAATSLDTNPNAKIDDVTTWRTHLPNDTDATNPFMKYWNWGFGGQTVYMPTFNKNKDSLTVDVNGTYEGDGTGTSYNDYVEYQASGQQSDPLDAYYDADSNTADEGPGKPGNGGIPGTNYKVETEVHTTADTANATVVTMAQWKAAGMPIGDFWVWDSDGWFYYAKALEPEKTTGLLLDWIKIKDYPEARYYYGINVVGEFATAGDWGTEGTVNSPATGFYEKGITQDGLDLLNRAASVITGEDGASYLDCGQNTYKKIANDGSLGALICAGPDKQIGNDDDITQGIIDLGENQNLTINGTSYGNLFLAPDGTTSAYRAVGPDGLLGTSDDTKIWYTGSNFPDGGNDDFSLVGADKVEISSSANVQSLCPTETLQFSAKVKLKNVLINNQNVTWSVSGNTSAMTSIDDNGKLTIAEDEKAGTGRTLTITATSKEDRNASATYTVNIEGAGSIVLTASKTDAEPGDVITFTMNVFKADGTTLYPTQKVKWTLQGQTDADTIFDEANKTLTIGAGEAKGKTLTLTVTSVNDSSKVVSFKMNLPMYKTNADGSINIDGVDFWKLTEDGSGYTLLITKNYAYAVSSLTSLQRWMTSDVRSYLNSTWISQYPTLDAMSKTVSIYTITDYNSQSDGDIDETQDKVFILSETDAFGTSNSQPVTNTKLYTIGRQLTELKTVWVSQLYSMALRSPRNNSTGVADSTYDLSAPGDYVSGTWGICPLLWVNLSYVPTSS